MTTIAKPVESALYPRVHERFYPPAVTEFHLFHLIAAGQAIAKQAYSARGGPSHPNGSTSSLTLVWTFIPPYILRLNQRLQLYRAGRDDTKIISSGEDELLNSNLLANKYRALLCVCAGRAGHHNERLNRCDMEDTTAWNQTWLHPHTHLFTTLTMSLILKSLAAALIASQGALAVGTAFGYGAGTTGGGNLTPAVPSSPAQLASWLGDSTPRVILLDKTYDFTDLEGSVTGSGCKPWTCSPGAQIAINLNGWCEREQKNSEVVPSITYKKAGLTPINVGSNKTLLGKGTAGWIKGKGIRIAGSSNIIIQNVRFSDINAAFVWGGDALTIDGGKRIWIDHNYFKSVGRQFIVTGFGAAEGVTISDNVFDGSGTYSTRCDGHHYWALYFTGGGDTITFARNYMYQTAGRGPKIGGNSPHSQIVHMYNNYFVDITDHALDAGVGSKVLVEGNYFNRVVQPAVGGHSGIVFAPTSAAMNSQCSSGLGRACVSNTLLGSGEIKDSAYTAAIGYFNSAAVKGASVMDPSKVGAYVQTNAGTGKIN